MVLEQPCDSLEEICAIRDRLHHPIYLDESITDLAVALRAIGEARADREWFAVAPPELLVALVQPAIDQHTVRRSGQRFWRGKRRCGLDRQP